MNLCTYFTSPYSDAWYLGPEKGTHRDMGSRPELTYEYCLAPVFEAATYSRTFMRAQPWQLIERYNTLETLCRFQPSILVRNPAYSVPSLHSHKADVREEETGFAGLHRTWTMLRGVGEDVPIVDANDIQKNPVAYVGAWCDAVSIDRNDKAVQWNKEEVKDWSDWKDYTRTVVSSTGFLPPVSPPQVKSEYVARLIDAVSPYYRELEAHKIML